MSESSPSGPARTRLPDGFTATVDGRVRRLGIGVLLGGSPPAVLRLTPAAQRMLDGDRVLVRDAGTAALARRLLDAGVANPGPPTGAVSPVTVVIPVRDNAIGLARLLAALRRTAPEHPVIVVDDGSARPVGAPGARVLRHPVSRGPAAARNTGLAAAGTALVAFCDSDVLPGNPGWLGDLAAHFADPALAMVAPRITAIDGLTGWIGDYERVRSSLDIGPREAPVYPTSAVSYVPSATMVVRVAAVRDGFDERLHVAEDVDLVFRLHAEGWRMRYLPSVTVAHDHRVTLRPWLARKAFYGTGAAPLALRHPGQVPPVRLAPWTAAAGVALLAQRRWSVPVAAAVTAAATVRWGRTLPVPRPWRTAARLAPLGLGAALWQLGAALVRHWWPVAALACLVSRRARRAVAVAAVAEAAADRWSRGRDVGSLRYLVAHRLDDLAYGAGLWHGALRHRTVAPLLPVIARRRRGARAVPGTGSRGHPPIGEGRC